MQESPPFTVGFPIVNFEFSILFSAATTAITAALTGHGRCRLAVTTAVGATDALVPALLCLYNIGSCKTHNNKHNCYYNNIDHISAPLVS